MDNALAPLLEIPSPNAWQKNPIFAAAGPITCAELARDYPAMICERQSTLILAGDPAEELYVLLRGTVRVCRPSPEGREQLVRLLRAPALLGDSELLCGQPHLTTSVALEEVEVACLPGALFLELLQRHPAMTLELLRQRAAADCLTTFNLAQAFATAEQRVANLLLAYVELFGEPCAGGQRIAHPLSHGEIARALDLVRRSVVSVFSSWTKAGLVERSADRIVLHDVGRLAAIAGPLRGGLCQQLGRTLCIPTMQRLAAPELVVLEGAPPDVGRRIAIDREVMVGREAYCQLALADRSISRRHCRVYRGEPRGRYWVEDLDSTGGTWVRDRRVRRAVLHDGWCIRIGETVLGFVAPARV